MKNVLAFVLISTLAPVSQAAEIYQCIENGSMTLSDKPCTQDAEQQKTIHIKNSTSTAGVESGQKPDSSNKQRTDSKTDDVLREKVVGQWQFTGQLLGGWEDRTFFEDGTFQSHGKDEFAETTGTGTWSLKGDKLTITAKFENIRPSGEKTTVSNILKLTVKSIDDTEMVLYWPRYDSSNTWVRQ